MRNLSPGDDEQQRRLLTHIDTFTMRTFSDSSAKKFAQRSPSRSTSAKKFAQRSRKHRFSHVLIMQGELFRAHTHTRPSRANFFVHRTR